MDVGKDCIGIQIAVGIKLHAASMNVVLRTVLQILICKHVVGQCLRSPPRAEPTNDKFYLALNSSYETRTKSPSGKFRKSPRDVNMRLRSRSSLSPFLWGEFQRLFLEVVQCSTPVQAAPRSL